MQPVSLSQLHIWFVLIELFAFVCGSFSYCPTSLTPCPFVKNATFNKNYEGILNSQSPHTYLFQLDPLYEKFLSTNVRLKVIANVTGGDPHKSLSVTVLQPSAISSSFRLPTFNRRTDAHIPPGDYFSGERTICILDSNANESIPFSVVLSTKSEKDILFVLVITLTEDFLLELNSTKKFTLSPNRPFYFRYEFEESVNSVRILADTKALGDACMTLSVQTAVCPIFDQEESIYYEGTYQTIRSSGALYVKKNKYFQSGFIIVLLAHPDDEECLRRDPLSVPGPHTRLLGGLRDKFFTDINVTLRVVSDAIEFPNTGKNFICWTLPIIIAILICFGSWVALKFKHRLLIRVGPREIYVYGSGFWDRLGRILSSNMYISQFGDLNSKHGNGFYHYVTVTGVFYAVPVCQFAVYYYMVSISTGDTDLCYYNYRCAQAIGPFSDLNHIVSNVAYIMYGIVFILFASKRKSEIEAFTPPPLPVDNQEESNELVPNPHQEIKYGIPVNFGMFKALGAALLMEGVFSASYHMCPNEATFQFDTCFMYVIALLQIIHVGQLRNAEFLTPFVTFAVLASIGVLSVSAVIINVFIIPINKKWFCIPFVVIQIIVTVLLTFNHVFVGVLREDTNELVTGWRIYLHIGKKSTWTFNRISATTLL
ncbi:unnamed protein product [Orchesella dallaii]|uniref:SID1 transmembrane family member 1 n=1 Tax=Orchesella dallaii TaxID=48710 RepID=A0ABP1RGV0_9HEXA